MPVVNRWTTRDWLLRIINSPQRIYELYSKNIWCQSSTDAQIVTNYYLSLIPHKESMNFFLKFYDHFHIKEPTNLIEMEPVIGRKVWGHVSTFDTTETNWRWELDA